MFLGSLDPEWRYTKDRFNRMGKSGYRPSRRFKG